ncbi:hypothetical protein Plhal710r2_c017g0075881 [Plasmopara halstedii]
MVETLSALLRLVNMKIVVIKSCSASSSCMTTNEMVWAYASVEKVKDVSSDIVVCDGPCSQDSPKKLNVKAPTAGGAARRQKRLSPLLSAWKSWSMVV